VTARSVPATSGMSTSHALPSAAAHSAAAIRRPIPGMPQPLVAIAGTGATVASPDMTRATRWPSP
jgi:hypothetical protein